VATDIKTAREACDAWKPVIAEVMEKKFGTKLLGLAPNPGIVFWCRTEIGGLADLKGKKVRVFNRTLADFVTAVGGTTVTTPFGEVAAALKNGVFDCALTSTLSGNTAGWPEVTEYLLPLPVGWSIYYQSANLNSWNDFDPRVQTFFEKKFAELDDRLWELGEQMYQQGVSCNIGEEPCTLGKPGDMKLVEVSDADRQMRKKLVEDVVLVEWGRRCGAECATKWNETVGKVVGLQIPVDKL
jgi:TRAP-type transport system periplasmic protein